MLFSLTLTFNGVIQTPQALPGFWIFMYRVSPLTYLVSGMLATGVHGRPVNCASNEINVFDPPVGETCGTYLLNPSATANCWYCPLQTADQFLASLNMSWDTRWRNLGLMWVYIAFNVCMTFWLYWWFRIRKTTVTESITSFLGRLRRDKRANEDQEGDKDEDEKLERMLSAQRKTEVQPRAY